MQEQLKQAWAGNDNWVNYNDLTRHQLKWWFMWGIAPQPAWRNIIIHPDDKVPITAADMGNKAIMLVLHALRAMS